LLKNLLKGTNNLYRRDTGIRKIDTLASYLIIVKKLTAASFLIMIFISQVCYYFYYSYRQHQIKEEIKKGDVFDIVNVPGKGVVVSKNGKEKGVIDGADFKKALFGIWLSGKPADKNLKEAMLGK